MNASNQKPIITLKNVCKSFGDFQALRNFNLEVSKGGGKQRRTDCGMRAFRVRQIDHDPLYQPA
jgi:hypothetical protein